MQIPSRKSFLAPSFLPSTNAVGITVAARAHETAHHLSEHRSGGWQGYGVSRVASALAALAMAVITMLALVLLPANVETGNATPTDVTTGGFHADKG